MVNMKRINLVKVENLDYDFEGKKVPVIICHGITDEIYHVTSLSSLRKILLDGKLKVTEESESGSISFSVNPQHVYGSGNIKMIFRRDKIEHLLRPMHYYSDAEASMMKYKIRERQEEIAKKEGITPEASQAITGLAPDSLANECEWYSF